MCHPECGHAGLYLPQKVPELHAPEGGIVMRNSYDINSDFTCKHCGIFVTSLTPISGVINRNHCPYCLWSRHLDLYEAGDRLCACKASMRPIGLTIKQTRKKYAQSGGELMLVHLCVECGAVSINRIAADDLTERILDVFEDSLAEMENISGAVNLGRIQLLGPDKYPLIRARLFGDVPQYA